MGGLSLSVGFGLPTSFWEDTWVGDSLFLLRVPIPFEIFDQTNKYVGETSRWEAESWIWHLKWRRSFLFDYELTLLTEF